MDTKIYAKVFGVLLAKLSKNLLERKIEEGRKVKMTYKVELTSVNGFPGTQSVTLDSDNWPEWNDMSKPGCY